MDCHAGSRPRLTNQLTDRRSTYRRSQTVSALPIFGNSEQLGERTAKTSSPGQVKAAVSDQDSRAAAAGDLSPRGRRSTDVLDGFRKSWSFRSTIPRQRVVHVGGCQTLLHPQGEKPRGRLPLCRTPSSPSILLSKVREKIKEKVIETSVEWPSMAVIVQEKRQKAVSAFEAQLSRVHGVLLVDHENPTLDQNCASKLVVKKVLTQSRSTSGEITSVRERSRMELRRRSISMDTFERMSRSISRDKSPTSSTKTEPGGSGGGVVCTTDDLRSIMNSHREEFSRHNSKTSLHRFENVPRKYSSLREKRDRTAAVTSSGLNFANHVDPEMNRNSNPISPSNDLRIRLSCAAFNEPTSSAVSTNPSSTNSSSTNSLQKPEAMRSHSTLFRSSSANTSSSKAKSIAASSGNRKGFFFRRSASVCSTPSPGRTSPALTGPVHHLEEAPSVRLKTSSSIKDHASTCLVGGRTRFPSICSSSPRKGKAGTEPVELESELVYSTNDFDPEIIGQAIQVHLETMMRSRTSSDELVN